MTEHSAPVAALAEAEDGTEAGQSTLRAQPRPLTGNRWLVWGAVLMALAPGTLTLCYELSVWSQRVLFEGDLPMLEIHVIDLMRGKHLLGAYSRMGWHHPGPLYFAALVPLYVLSGHASGSLYLSAALLALAAVVAMVAVFWRLQASLAQRVLFAALLCSFLAHFASFHGLGFPWNPSVCVLPFGVYWLLLVALAAGHSRVLPFAALLHAFVVQAHISYALVASVAAVLALALWRLQRSWDGGRRPLESLARVWVSTALVMVVAWSLPVWAELTSGRSNVAAIVGAHDRVASSSSLPALGLAVRELFSPLSHAAGFPHPDLLRREHAAPLEQAVAGATTIGAVLLAIQAVALALVARQALARRERLALAGSVLGLAGLVLACLSARHVGKFHHPYMTYWFGLIGTLNWLPIIGMWLRPWLARPLTLYLAAAAALSLSALASRAAITSAPWRTGRNERFRDTVAATDEVAPLALGTSVRAPAVLGLGRDRPNLTGVVAMLRKRGIVPLLDGRLTKFGGGFDYRSAKDAEHPWLIFAGAPSHEDPILASLGSLHLYWRSQDKSGVAPRLTLSASGAEGDPAALLGGARPRERRSPSAGVLTLKDETSEVILHLGGARVAWVGLRAQADAGYSLEASADGRTYEPMATLPAGSGSGMVTQRFSVSAPGPWETLRLKAHGGGGQTGYAIAKLSAKLLGWGVRVESARGLEGDLGVVSDGIGARKRGSVVRFSGANAELVVSLPTGSEDVHVAGLRIDAQASDAYAIEGSYDGSSFEPIGVSKGGRGAGMRSRLFHFNDLRAWRYARLSPAARGKKLALAELSVVMGDGPLLDLDEPSGPGASGTAPRAQAQRPQVKAASPEGALSLGVVLDASRSYDLIIAAAPRGRARLDVSINGQSAGTLDIAPSRTTHHVDIPPGALHDGTAQVALTPASSSPHADVRLRSLLFRAHEPRNLRTDVRYGRVTSGG